jgi:hypothetical protein
MTMTLARRITIALVLIVMSGTSRLVAQQPAGRGAPPGPPPPFDVAQGAPSASRGATPRASAPIDLTGTWVSIVNEDWRWRMVTPPPGDYPGIPLNPAGQKLAQAWDPAMNGSCQAFGAAALLRMPTRVRIAWEGERTLKLETDNGQQVRRLMFGSQARPAHRTLQGQSGAEWVRTLPPSNPFGLAFPGGPPPPGGGLKVVTTHTSGGWLRRNGVPYSENAVVTEYFDRFPVPNGGEWFVVTTVVDDPIYLLRPFVTSSHFRREMDDSKWLPRPCRM